jgi:hypothetical protein
MSDSKNGAIFFIFHLLSRLNALTSSAVEYSGVYIPLTYGKYGPLLSSYVITAQVTADVGCDELKG